MDVDSSAVNYIQFVTRIGGGDSKTCNNVSSHGAGVVVEYSNDGADTWKYLKMMQDQEYQQPK